VGNLFDPAGGLLPLQFDDLLFDSGSELLAPLTIQRGGRLQPCLPVPMVTADPRGQRAVGDAEFPADQLDGIAFLQPQLDRFQSKRDRIDKVGIALTLPPPRKPPRGLGDLLRLF
jgi:hypothetical protein